MEKRLRLHNQLVSIFGKDRTYYQVPPNYGMVYPCVVYKLQGNREVFADDSVFTRYRSYTVTIMDENPDSDLYLKVLDNVKYSSFDRVYSAEGLYHYVLIVSIF